MRNKLPFLMIWTNSYERLTWTPLLVLIAFQLDNPATSLAYAASAYSAANLVGNLFFGSLSDRFGRYKIAGIALIAMAVTTLFHLRVWSVLVFVGIRLLHGFFAAAVTPSSLAAASDGIAWEERGQIMARMGLMIAFASIVAPPIAGRIVDSTSLTVTIVVQALFLLVIGVIGTIDFKKKTTVKIDNVLEDETVTKESASPVTADSFNEKESNKDRDESSTFDIKITLFACVVGFSIMFGQNILFYALPLKARFADLSPSTIGGLFGVFAVGAAVAFMPPFSKLADRFGRVRPIVIGCAMAAAGLFFLGRSVAGASMGFMVASLLLYGFGFGISFPAVSASTADGAMESKRGLAFGLLTAAFSVGSVLGPIVSQALDGLMSPFTVAAIVMVAGLSAVLLTRNVSELHGVPTGA